MGVENIDSFEELKRLDEQIESANEIAALKPLYFRLNEIMQASPGDFDVQFTGNEIKQRLMARGTALKQQGISPPSQAAPTPPAMPAAVPSPEPAPLLDTPPPAPPSPAAPADPALQFDGPSPEFPLFPLFASAPAPPQPSARPAYVAPAPSPAASTPPEPPAETAYFAETMSSPVAPHGPGAMQSPAPTPVPMFNPSVDAALPEPPLPVLDATPDPAPEPPALGDPAAQVPPPTPLPDALAAPTEPSAETPSPWSSRLAALFASEPLGPAAHEPATLPEIPPAPPMPVAPAPPLADLFQDSAPPPPPPPLPPSAPLADSPKPAPPPPALVETPEIPHQPPVLPPPPPPPVPPRAPSHWNRLLLLVPIAVVLIAGVIAVVIVHRNGVRAAKEAARIRVAVEIGISTTPPGALVKVVAQGSATGAAPATCTADCKLALVPGTYQFTASLDGFDPATGVVTVRTAKPASISLTLQPQAQSVRLLTDLMQGKVVVDDRPPADLQDGQLVLDKVTTGTHTIKVAGPNGDASFSFAVADSRLPVVSGPVNARNMVAILVSSFGKQARIVTNAGPWKLAVNGQPQSDAGPAGTDLTGFQPGVNEIVVGDGNDRRNMSESFGAAPMLTAFLKTDVNAGTLIVSTGLDDVRVFINGKEYKLRTQHGKLRVQMLGKVAVRVTKSGFLDEPEQTTEVKKGAEVRLQFDMKPQPQLASLEIRGAIAGTEVLIDQRSAGTVGPDGLFGPSAIQPGEHTIDLRREQYLPKRLQRAFRAGQTVSLAAADVALMSANGTVRIARNPASATVTYRRGEEADAREVRGSQVELPAGSYVFSASAPGYNGSVTRVQIAAGESREVSFNLAREGPAAPVPMANAMAQFQDAQSWTKEGDSWVHKGGGFVPFRPSPKGVFTFKAELVKGGGVFRSGALRWCLQYVDAKNYLLFELDRKNFRAWVVKDGQRLERVPKTPHNLGNQKSFTIQIDVTAARLVQTVRGGEAWKPLDSFSEPARDFTQGRFAFLIQGNDEIAISDFLFVPR